MKTAIIHDWLVAFGGAEKVLKVLHDLYPSPIFTLVQNESLAKSKGFGAIQISPLQKFPFATRFYREYLPFFPWAIEQFDLREFDLVISNSHAAAKGVITHPHQLHLCYCLTPMRYAWDFYHTYMSGLNGIKKLCAQKVLHRVRLWDAMNASRVDHFAAISQYVAKRIKKYYGRDSEVIYPPVDTQKFLLKEKKEDFYLAVSRFVPYKRIDVIVEAFQFMPGKKLVLIGDGPERKKILKVAGKNIEFLGPQSDEIVVEIMGRAKAFIFAAEEDFGIAPVEAQAAGTPVIAYGKGAVLETVVPNQTGIFFEEPTVGAIVDAIKQFEKWQEYFEPEKIREHAEKFSVERFKTEWNLFVKQKYEAFYENRHIGGRERDSALAHF